MTQWRVLCPHNHLLKTTTTTGDIRELFSPQLVQSTSSLVHELSSPRVDQSARYPVRELAYPWVVQLPFLLVPAHPVSPGQRAIKRLLLLLCTARHWSIGRQPNLVAFNRRCHLYSAGWPSRWASAHILVIIIIRPHHHTTWADAAYCYRMRRVVCWSLCHSSETSKNGWTDRDVICYNKLTKGYMVTSSQNVNDTSKIVTSIPLGYVAFGTWQFRYKGWTVSVHDDFGTYEINFSTCFL